MIKVITPEVITEDIKSFCKGINPTAELEYINVVPDAKSLPPGCFNNVKAKVETLGGREQLGWIIWLFPNILIEAEIHSIWISHSKEKIDIAPNDTNTGTILFLPENSIHYEGRVMPNKRLVLTSSLLVSEFIELANERDVIFSRCSPSQKICGIPTALILRMQEILHIFNTKECTKYLINNMV